MPVYVGVLRMQCLHLVIELLGSNCCCILHLSCCWNRTVALVHQLSVQCGHSSSFLHIDCIKSSFGLLAFMLNLITSSTEISVMFNKPKSTVNIFHERKK